MTTIDQLINTWEHPKDCPKCGGKGWWRGTFDRDAWYACDGILGGTEPSGGTDDPAPDSRPRFSRSES